MMELDFLRECGVFYLLTVNEGKPAGRPFGAVMEHEGKLYFSTGTMKDVYRQLKANGQIQIVALKNGTRDWIRIDGRAEECCDVLVKAKMLEECPVLKNRFDSPECEYYALFSVEDMQAHIM